MPRRINAPPMTAFRDWLLANGTGESSAVAYASAVRGALARMEGPLDAEGLRRHCAGKSPGGRSVLVTGWHRFQAFALQAGKQVADLHAGNAALPPPVCAALHTLITICGVTPRTLAALTWTDVTFYDRSATLRMPVGAGRMKTLPPAGTAALQRLRTWAAPPATDAPLVPSEPGSWIFRGEGQIREDAQSVVGRTVTPRTAPDTADPTVAALPAAPFEAAPVVAKERPLVTPPEVLERLSRPPPPIDDADVPESLRGL